jgi:hypothetical protein
LQSNGSPLRLRFWLAWASPGKTRAWCGWPDGCKDGLFDAAVDQTLPPHVLPTCLLLDFLVRRVLAAKAAILVPLQSVRIVFLILHGRIVSVFTDRTRHGNDVPHC